MRFDPGAACGLQGRMAGEGFLRQSAEQAGELGEFPAHQCGTKIEVSQQARARIVDLPIRCLRKQRARQFVPVLDGSEHRRFLAFEMMKEAALGHAGATAQIVDRGRGVAFAADLAKGGVEKTGARIEGVRRRRRQRNLRSHGLGWNERRKRCARNGHKASRVGKHAQAD